MKSSLNDNNRAVRRGFTLIELLVVISIIALLAGVAGPGFQVAMVTAQQSAAAKKAQQIVLGLRAYAIDNNGSFPSTDPVTGAAFESSNEAFRTLVPTYLDSEAVFVVSRSRFGPKADDKVDPATEILKPGENHFAYISGLNDTSKSRWPLVSDGSDAYGTFRTDESQPAGTWKGQKGILGNVDGSVQIVAMRGPTDARYIPRFDDVTKNALNVAEYMGTEAKLLNPALASK